MAKNISIITIVLLILVALYIIFNLFFKKDYQNTNLKLNGHDYQIEIAQTITQKSQGLSHRDQLCSNCGMIFLFNYQSTLPFWMKDTLFPLDLIWIDSDGKIVDIQTATETNSQKIYKNSSPAQYVLEINAGDCQKIGLKTGDIVDLSNIK
ncbi:MAG: DUF192 domain-containing protein [Candidatus Shapirobacteria bacterium]|nr:DUF192 domain-containing protein [Candidatus Shapirobacteria bacterium]